MEMQQVVIYRAAGMYAGWPANYGMWHWGNELVLGFTVGHVQPHVHFHARDKSRPFVTLQARSLDGGESWTVAPFPGKSPGGKGLSADEHMEPALWSLHDVDGPDGPTPCPGTVDFTHPDFALMCARTGLRAGSRSWFYLSTDRAHTWQGPYTLPMFGQTGLAARTDYLVDGPARLTLFLTAAKANGEEGRVFCARTEDGGRSFAWVGWLTPEPAGYRIMPASLRLPTGRILTALRCSEGTVTSNAQRKWIDLYASDDDGGSWAQVSTPVPDAGYGGNPATLTRLHDGRICLTYGHRDAPFEIRALLSADGGATWSAPIALHSGAGNQDLGYPRTIQRPDGMMVTAYYFNDHPDEERYIAATLWRP
jgi:hypothetical protein